MLCVAFMACKQGKTDIDSDVDNDSLIGYQDSLLLQPEVDASEQMPVSADELFDDFIFEFANLASLQKKRVHFPLPIVNKTDTTWLSKQAFKTIEVFPSSEYYTVFFANEEEQELEKQTNLTHVEINHFNVESDRCKTMYFQRQKGQWMLTMIKEESLKHNILGGFLNFYQRFVQDKAFQEHCVNVPLKFITTDPEDDFNMIEEHLSLEQWKELSAQLPQGIMTQVNYGQSFGSLDEVVMVKRGIGNGLMDIFTFEQKGTEWELSCYEN